MKLPRGLHRDHNFGAMTSMIDVVLFLLMFFVVTSGSGQLALLLPAPLSRAGEIESPESNSSTQRSAQIDIWLKLQFDPERQQTVVDMNGTAYRSLAQLKSQLVALAELDSANPVIFDTGADVPLGDLVTLYDTCQAAGFQSISFATKSQMPKQP